MSDKCKWGMSHLGWPPGTTELCVYCERDALKADLAEINEALGDNEGHNAATGIRKLKAEVERLTTELHSQTGMMQELLKILKGNKIVHSTLEQECIDAAKALVARCEEAREIIHGYHALTGGRGVLKAEMWLDGKP